MDKAEAARAKFKDYVKDPNYIIRLEPHEGRVCVVRGGVVLADSERAIDLLEPRHMPIIYFPRQDVNLELLEATDHATHCPYKGDATYWSVVVAGDKAENAVWSYEAPITEVAGIKDLMAFYSSDMGASYGIEVVEP